MAPSPAAPNPQSEALLRLFRFICYSLDLALPLPVHVTRRALSTIILLAALGLQSGRVRLQTASVSFGPRVLTLYDNYHGPYYSTPGAA